MDEIETKINMLYDFIYSKNHKEDHQDNQDDIKIDLENISIDDIKIKFKGDKYDDILASLFTGKFKMVDFNENTNNLVLKRYTDGLSISLFVSPYNEININEIDNINNMNNNDCLFSYILSALVLSHKTKHIALPIINVDIKFSQMNDIIKPYEDIYKKYIEMIKEEQISNIFSVRVKENFFKSMQLTEFIKSSDCNYKILLFQLIHTLAVLQKEYPGFRHNMLNLSNIYVYLKKGETEEYHYNNKKFYIPNNTFEIKITNFFAANIPGMYGSNIDGPLNIPFFDDNNAYFDLHYFLNNFLKVVDTLDKTLDVDTIEFMDKVIPEKYRTNKKMYIRENDELFGPEELLDDNYFNEFTKEIKGYNSVERTMSADNYYTNHSHSSNRKSSISGRRKVKNIENHMNNNLIGGATFYHPPIKTPANTPFISNDARNVYKRDLDPKETKEKEKEKEKVDPTLVMRQEVRTNPNYVKPFKVKEKPTWDPEYKPLTKPSYVPQAKVYYKPNDDKSYNKPSTSDDSDSDMKEITDDETISITDNKTTEDKEPKIDEYLEKMYPNAEEKKYKHFDSDKRNKVYKVEEKQERSYSPTFKKDNYQPYKRDFNTEKSSRFNNSERKEYPERQEQSLRHDKFERKEYSERPDKFERKEYPDRTYSPKPPNYQKNITENQVIAEQKMYQPVPNIPPGALHTHPKYANPAFVPIDNQITYPPAFVPDLANYFPFQGVPLSKPNELPLQKVYNINLGAPGHHHTILNKIYQDSLPGEPNIYTMNNVYERMQIMNLLSNSMIKHHDGEDMTLQAGPKSMLEYIKFLEFNPYSLGRNKYKNIPINFLLYNGAYPVRYNMDTRNIEIAKQSTGINIRVYMLSNGALNCNINANLDCHNFDVWRELSYYKYVKETILQQKISPNFISMILYKLDRVSKINYNELNKVIETHVNNDIILRNLNNYKEINKFLASISNDSKTLIGQATNAIQSNTLSNQRLNTGVSLDLSANSQVSLLALTEAPTSNLIEWASPTYQRSGAVAKQVTTGFHTTDVWRSVLFQLVSAMAVLQEKKILFRNFSFENNVFIKDLFKDPNNTGHWVYTVNNIDMYVPNFGHLLVIDSRFADVNPIAGVTGVHKIVSTTLFNNNGNNFPSDGTSYIENEILNDLKRIIKKNNFVSSGVSKGIYSDYGMVAPDIDILNLLDNIYNSASINTRIADILIECFPQYIHNRVGTLLNITEKTGLSLTVMPKLIPGKLVVYQSRYDEYTWVIFNRDIDAKKKEILIKDNNGKLYKKIVFSHSLVEHPDSNNIMQISEKSFRLNKDSLIDSYNITNGFSAL
jgi:hypothetical protein